MARLTALAIALAGFASVAGLALDAATADEATSLHPAGGQAWPLVVDARAAGVEVQRAVSFPLPDSALDPRRSAIAVFHADRALSDADQSDLDTYLRQGGTLLLADPFHAGNQAAGPHGVMAEQVRLVDPLAQGSRIRLLATEFSVNWTQPSALRVTNPLAAVLAASHEGSFLDRGGDGLIDDADPAGRFPVAVEVPVGAQGGRILVFADASPFLSETAAHADHALLRRALVDHLLPHGGILVVDESRLPQGPASDAFLSVAFDAFRQPAWRYLALGLAGLAIALPGIPHLAGSLQRHSFRPHRFLRRGRVPEEQSHKVGPAWTRRGLFALAAAFAFIVGGLSLRRPEAIAAGSVIATALAASLAFRAPRVEASRDLSGTRMTEGSPAQVRVLLKASRPVDLQVADRLPQDFDVQQGSSWMEVSLAANLEKRLEYTCSPARSGPAHVGPLLARSCDPLDLRARQAELVPATPVEVAPRPRMLRRNPFATKSPSLTLGPHKVSRAGDGSEFHALRDYAQGDPLRMVNWKASARSKSLMVNQRVHESMTTLTILLDARAVSDAGHASRTPFVTGCRHAITLAETATRMRDRLAFVSYGDGVTTMRRQSGPRQVMELREVLARLRPAGTTGLEEAVAAMADGLRPRMPVIVLSALEDDPTAFEGLRTLRDRGMLPMVLAPAIDLAADDPTEGDDRHLAPVAQQRQALLMRLRSLGIPVYDSVEHMPLDQVFQLGAP